MPSCTRLYHQVKSSADCDILQRDIDALQQWEDDWLVAFNPSKCEIVHIITHMSPNHYQYAIHGEPLKAVKKAKYICVNINTTLSCNNHINSITNEATSTIQFSMAEHRQLTAQDH